MFTMRGEAKWIPPQGTGPVRKERSRRLKGGIEVPKSFEGERVKEKADNPYGVVELKKRFIQNEIDNAVPMDTPDRDQVIEQLVDRAYTGPTQSEFFKAKTKAEMRGVVEQVLTERSMGSEPAEPQMTAQEAQAEANRVLEEEMRKRGHEISKAKKGLESVFGDQPIEGDQIEVVPAGQTTENRPDYKTETVEVPEEPLSPEEQAAAAEAERALKQELAARGLGERPASEEIAMPSAEEEELPELGDEDIEALGEEEAPKAAQLATAYGGHAAQKATGQEVNVATGATREVSQIDRGEFLNKLAEQRKEQLQQKLEGGMSVEDLNELLDAEIEDADMDIEELEDDQETFIKQAINKREVALKLKEWLADQSDAAAAK